MSTGRSLRNVFVYDTTSSPPTLVAGVYQPPAGIWRINTFYRVLKLCFEQQTLPGSWRLVSSSDNSILSPSSEQSLLAGSYFVANSAGLSCPVELTTTVFHRRNATPPSTPSQHDWSAKIKERDEDRCAVVGIEASEYSQACHIVPKTLPTTLQAPALQHDSSNSLYPINSYENGIVLSDHFQRAFDRYAISFDMDDNYRIMPFDEASEKWLALLGKLGQCSPTLGQNPTHATIPPPSDILLRWHFEQAVLSNIRGAGEIKEDEYDERLLQGEVDLSKEGWATEGQGVLERHFAHRLAAG